MGKLVEIVSTPNFAFSIKAIAIHYIKEYNTWQLKSPLRDLLRVGVGYCSSRQAKVFPFRFAFMARFLAGGLSACALLVGQTATGADRVSTRFFTCSHQPCPQ